MTDIGYVYSVVKEVNIGGEWHMVMVNGLPMVKIGFSKEPEVRHEEPVRESSTWHPERFRCIDLKKVPSMRDAEKKLHTFFEEDNITPAYPKGGVEWFVVSLERVKMVFEALKQKGKEPYKHKHPSISIELVQNILNTITIEEYDSVRPEGYPSIQDIRDGYFGEDRTDIAMLVPTVRR